MSKMFKMLKSDFTDIGIEGLPSFMKFLKSQMSACGFKYTIIVPGNHEIIPDALKYFPLSKIWPENCFFLLDEVKTLNIPFQNEEDDGDGEFFGKVVVYGSRYRPFWSFPR